MPYCLLSLVLILTSKMYWPFGASAGMSTRIDSLVCSFSSMIKTSGVYNNQVRAVSLISGVVASALFLSVNLFNSMFMVNSVPYFLSLFKMPMPKRWESPPESVATCNGNATCLPWSTSKCSNSVLVFSSKSFF